MNLFKKKKTYINIVRSQEDEFKQLPKNSGRNMGEMQSVRKDHISEGAYRIQNLSRMQ